MHENNQAIVWMIKTSRLLIVIKIVRGNKRCDYSIFWTEEKNKENGPNFIWEYKYKYKIHNLKIKINSPQITGCNSIHFA